MAEDYVSVGKLGKPHGLSGAFRFLLTGELKSKKKAPDHFMLEDKGSVLPFFISKLEWLGFSEGLITFEEISSIEEARRHVNKELLLRPSDVEKLFKKNVDDTAFLIGYKAHDEEAGELGTIAAIEEHPGQVLCTVKRGEDEVVIPLVDEFISRINKRKKEIVFNLPQGLLDL